jgi:hypothetical protein
MGLIRKAASVSTLGGVKYTSRREAQTKAASAQASAARADAKLAKAQRKQVEAETAAEATAPATATHPEKWYEEQTLGGLISRGLRKAGDKN